MTERADIYGVMTSEKELSLSPFGRRLLACVTLLVVIGASIAIGLEHTKSTAIANRGIWVQAEVQHHWKNLTRKTYGLSYSFVTSDKETINARKQTVKKPIYGQAKRDGTIPIVYDPNNPHVQAFSLENQPSTLDLLFNLLMLCPLLIFAGWLIKSSYKNSIFK